MTYAEWSETFLEAVRRDPKQRARIWNLDNETRIDEARNKFQERIVQNHQANVADGLSPDRAAVGALYSAIEETQTVDSHWLGLLPLTPGTSLPSHVVTFVHSRDARRYSGRPIDPDHPPRRLSRVALKSRNDGPDERRAETRFLWVTFSDEAKALPLSDPTRVKRELGLSHFSEGGYIYRFTLELSAAQARFVPTCLDAGLSPAWKVAPPEFEHPWGMTRDLTTGDSCWPEVLLETGDYLNRPPDGALVSPDGGPTVAIGPVEVDYMAGR